MQRLIGRACMNKSEMNILLLIQMSKQQLQHAHLALQRQATPIHSACNASPKD